jgi:stearoyl-CoA desaturase (delta-9 desaturase)
MKTLFVSSTIGVQLFLILFFAGSIFAIYNYGLDITSAAIILLGYFLYGCLGIVVTFHRQLTHKSYITFPIITKIFSILGCLGGTGSPLAWTAIHINHHRKSDKVGDPHSPSIQGWRIFLLNYENDLDNKTKWRMRTVVTDKFHQLLHRYYFLILISWSLILFSIGGFYLMIFLHWAPAAITVIMSNIVNYIGHQPNWLGGFRRYETLDQSTNNWLWAIPSWGESWHNNHHRRPGSASCGEKWWEIDISAFIIRLIRTN